MSLIHESIIAAMRDIEAIPKDRKNTGQGYQFRGIDDVYLSLHSILANHGIFTVPEVLAERSEDRLTAKGGTLIYRVLKIAYHFYAVDGSEVVCTVIGEGMDSGDKASNKGMSVAHKYALLQVFCIPTDDAKDPENESHEVAPKKASVIQDECATLSKELGLSDAEKRTMWQASGQNHSNLVILLRKRRDEISAAFDKVVDDAKKIDEFIDDIPK